MGQKYKVLRGGVRQRDGAGWKRKSVGSTVELSDSAAASLLSRTPPVIEKATYSASEDTEKPEKTFVARTVKPIVRSVKKEENE